MTRILAIIMLAITAQAADIVLYSTVAPVSAYPTPVASTGWTNTYAWGDDGYWRAGVALPQPRFLIGSPGVATNWVQDLATGKYWTRKADIVSATNWTDAVAGVSNLNATAYAGFTDWRMPTVRDMQSLTDYRFYAPAISSTTGTNQWSNNTPFSGAVNGDFWTSSPRAVNTAQAFKFSTSEGMHAASAKTATIASWAVRP